MACSSCPDGIHQTSVLCAVAAKKLASQDRINSYGIMAPPGPHVGVLNQLHQLHQHISCVCKCVLLSPGVSEFRNDISDCNRHFNIEKSSTVSNRGIWAADMTTKCLQVCHTALDIAPCIWTIPGPACVLPDLTLTCVSAPVQPFGQCSMPCMAYIMLSMHSPIWFACARCSGCRHTPTALKASVSIKLQSTHDVMLVQRTCVVPFYQCHSLLTR